MNWTYEAIFAGATLLLLVLGLAVGWGLFKGKIEAFVDSSNTRHEGHDKRCDDLDARMTNVSNTVNDLNNKFDVHVAKMEGSLKLQEKTTSDISHDVKGALQIIKPISDWVVEKKAEDKVRKEKP